MLRKFRNLDEIQAAFTSAVDDLKMLQKRNDDAMAKNVQTIERCHQHNIELGEENSKALRFQQNLENLIGS